MNLGGTHSRGSSLPGQNATQFDQLNELNKNVRKLNKTLCCLTTGASSDPGGGGGGGITPTPFTFRYGITTAPLTTDDIVAGTAGTGAHGQKEVVMFPNVTDTLLWFAEPSIEPIKTVWFNTGLNQGPIGTDEVFGFPTIIGSWRLYVTNFDTTFVGTVEFRLS